MALKRIWSTRYILSATFIVAVLMLTWIVFRSLSLRQVKQANAPIRPQPISLPSDPFVEEFKQFGVSSVVHDLEAPGLPASAVHIGNDKLTDVGLSRLTGVATITAFSFDTGHLSDKGMQCLSKLTRLKYLHISGSAVSDRGFGVIGKLRLLERLDVS
jgi:hypothetical protein